MHKYVGVYISFVNVQLIFYVLRWKYSLIFFKIIYIYPILFLKKFAMKWMKIIYTCINSIQFNSIALPKTKLQKTQTKNCHKNQTSCTMNL
jgi:hypothetical protein